MNIVRGVSRALNGSKAVRLSLSVEVQSIIGAKAGTSMVVELERGKHKIDDTTVLNQEKNSYYLEQPLSVPLTLFRDSKRGFKSKFFSLRIRNQKKLLADMGQLDIANFAKNESPTAVTLEANGFKINIVVECIFIEEAGDIDDYASTAMDGNQDQDLDGFDDIQNYSSVVREELNAGNFSQDTENDVPCPPLNLSPPRKSSPRLKEKTSRRSRNSQSPSPYRNLGAVEELARQLRVAKGERDDALQKLAETQKLLSGENSIEKLHERANKAESSLTGANAEISSLKIQFTSQTETLETVERKLTKKDDEINQYMTELHSLKGKSIAQESESTSRIASLEEKLQTVLESSTDSERVLALEAKLTSTEELCTHLREQLDMTRRTQSETKEDLASVMTERNELRDSSKILEGVMKEAVSRASAAETSVSELQAKVAELDRARECDSEQAQTREGAMRATAHFRIKELEAGVEALSADHDQALARAAELASEQTLLQELKADHLKLIHELSIGCGLMEGLSSSAVSQSVLERLNHLKQATKSQGCSMDQLKEVEERQEATMKEKDQVIEQLRTLQREHEEVVATSGLDCSKIKKDAASCIFGRFVLLTKDKARFVKQAAKEITNASKSKGLRVEDFALLLERVGFLNVCEEHAQEIVSVLNQDSDVTLDQVLNEVPEYDFLNLVTMTQQAERDAVVMAQLKQQVVDNQLSATTLQSQMKEEARNQECMIDQLKKEFVEKLSLAVKKEREAAVEADTQKMSQEMKKREKALAAQEAALQYNSLRAQDKEEEMLQLVVSAKMSYAQAKEEVDSLKRENTRLSQLISEVKGQLANAKAAHEDMEATCQHALASHKASATELELLKKSSKKGSFFF